MQHSQTINSMQNWENKFFLFGTTTYTPNSIIFVYFSDIYFIGGFGTVAWVDVKEYETLQPDKIAVDGGEQYLKVIFLNSNSGF